MSDRDIVIRAEGIGKRYQLGQSVDLTRNFREAMMGLPAKLARLARHKTQRKTIAPGPKSDAAVSPAAEYDPETPPGTFWAVRDVSFEVRRGEVVGIIGRNGAGKSTLLKLLSRITSPTKGTAEMHGRLASLLEVGTGFHPELTGRENIYMNGAVLGMRKTEITAKFDEIVAFAEVEKFIDTPVKRYSSGMYVRLAFAVAAHLEPEILIVDEVLAVGDAAFQKKCLGRISDVSRSGRTVLFVSHNMAAVENLCNRGLLLRNGRVEFWGTAQAALAHYQDSIPQTMQLALNERTDRSGSGRVRVTDLRFFSREGEEVTSIRMGDTFSALLTVAGHLNNLIIGILFGNVLVKQLVRAYSYEQFPASLDVNGQTTLRITFPDFPLMHGVYDVHTWVGQLGECSDYLENAMPFTVEPWDIFGTGRLPDPHGGVTFCPCQWSIEA